MKKALLTVAMTCLLATASYAQFGGGFEGPVGVDQTPISVKQAVDSWDNTKVVLKGHILSALGDEKYTFTDGADQVIVEIDDEIWAGRKVTPENTVQIFGEVDKDMFKPTEIEVYSLTVLP